MKRLKKVIAGLLLAFGVPLSILAVTQILNPKTSPQDRDDALAVLFILTLPPTALGGWLVWGLYKQGQKEASDRLESIFYQLLEANNGQITLMRFAKETQLTGEQAKQYLDRKAKEFNATFDVGTQGGIIYHFTL